MATGTNGIRTINELKATGVWKFQNTNSLQVGYYTDGNKCPTLSQMQSCDDTTNYNITYPSGYTGTRLVPFNKISYSKVVKYSTLTINHYNSNITGSYYEPYPVITTNQITVPSQYYDGTEVPVYNYEQYTPKLVMKVDQTNWPTVTGNVYISYICVEYDYNTYQTVHYICYAFLTKAQVDSLRSGTNVEVSGYVRTY